MMPYFLVIDAPTDPKRSNCMNLFKRLFSKQPKKNPSLVPKEFLNRVRENEMATMEMQSAARTDASPSAILTPAIPLPAKDVAGWFGGAPRLPKELAWPEIDGTPLCFIAQIDLTQMPENIWSGVGPRQGQFAFFIHPTETRAKVLHFDGALEKRPGPSPVSSHWFSKLNDKRPPISTYFSEWPVRLTDNVGGIPDPVGWNEEMGIGLPRPFKSESLDLTDCAHHPFDEATLEALIETFDEALNGRMALAEKFLETKKLKEAVSSAIKALHAELALSCKRFAEIKGDLEPYCKTFDRDGIVPHLNALTDLTIGHMTYQRDDEEGYADIEVSSGKLVGSVSGYLQILESHAKHAYLKSPEKLNPDATSRFEKIWAFNAAHERGGISHPPKGFIYTPHGPSSPNEVLLELPTSDLIGWIWGDMYSVVLTMARNDLASGKFNNILVDISN
jgi:hypothetical protein